MIFTLLMACAGESTEAQLSQTTAPAPAAEQRTVTIYSGRGKRIIGWRALQEDGTGSGNHP